MTINRVSKLAGSVTNNAVKKIGGFLKMNKNFAGGTTYTDGTTEWRVFTTTGPLSTTNFAPTTLVYNPRSASIGSSLPGATCDILVVGGGGGSGQGTYSGGGGGGGYVYHENLSVPPASFTVTIGSGGAGSSSGGPSIFGSPSPSASITAVGGGYGVQDTENRPGGPGGSGGGGSFRPNNFNPNINGGSGTQPSQGGISGSSGRGSPGRPAPNPGGDHGGNGGGAGGQGGNSFGVPDSFLPTGGTFPATFLGAPSGNGTLWRSFAGGGGGQTIGSSSSISQTYPGRGNGGGVFSTGAPGVVIIKVK